MKNRFFALLLALCLLCGCAGPEPSSAPEPKPSSAPASEPSSQPQPQTTSDDPVPPPEEKETPGKKPTAWDFTVSKAAGDQSCAYLQVDVTAPEGTALDADTYRLNCMPLFEGPMGGGWGVDLLEDGDKTDNRLSFLVDLSFNGGLKNAKGILVISDVEAIYWSEGHKSDKVVPLLSGEWTVPFQLEYLGESTTCTPNQTVETTQGPLRITKVEIAPLSILIEYTGSASLEAAMSGVATSPGAVQVEVKDREGNTIHLGMSQGEGKGAALLSFDKAVNPETVASLTFDGAELPLTR